MQPSSLSLDRRFRFSEVEAPLLAGNLRCSADLCVCRQPSLGLHWRVRPRRLPGSTFELGRAARPDDYPANPRDRVYEPYVLRPPEEIVADLNRFLIGWGGYFRHGNSLRCFDKIDNYAFDRVARFLGKKHQARRPLKDGRGLLAERRDLIPRKLVGTIYHDPVHATR